MLLRRIRFILRQRKSWRTFILLWITAIGITTFYLAFRVVHIPQDLNDHPQVRLIKLNFTCIVLHSAFECILAMDSMGRFSSSHRWSFKPGKGQILSNGKISDTFQYGYDGMIFGCCSDNFLPFQCVHCDVSSRVQEFIQTFSLYFAAFVRQTCSQTCWKCDWPCDWRRQRWKMPTLDGNSSRCERQYLTKNVLNYHEWQSSTLNAIVRFTKKFWVLRELVPVSPFGAVSKK